MVKIAYILLCHKDPEAVIKQAEGLAAAGDYVAIHFDGRAKKAHFDALKAALRDNPNIVFSKKRAKCGWGEWSLVQATLYALETAEQSFPQATHFYMLSGDCMAIKSANYVHQFLADNDADYIESFDFFDSNWIKTGIKEERLIYRHFFNERNNKWLFYNSFWLQRRLGLKRKVPDDIQVQIGSQWWCLRRNTVEAVLKFCKERTDVMRFFKTTWIPDETFFQTIVRHLIPSKEIRTRTLTFLLFTDYGMPVNFYDDQFDLLLSQDHLFARKISPEAHALKERLSNLYTQSNAEFSISNEGASLFHFLTGRGRIGRRFAARFWENESSLGRGRELLIVVCKKWHVAKRLVNRIREQTDIPCFEFLFNEADTPLPDLGGIQKTLGKRTRHRRALMRMMFDYHNTDRMLICLDPSSLELIKDFDADRSTTRILEIKTNFSDEYLAGHAQRVGLAGERTPPDTLKRILPTIRNDFYFESDQIRDAEFEHHAFLREDADGDRNARHVARFLALEHQDAIHLLDAPYLYTD